MTKNIFVHLPKVGGKLLMRDSLNQQFIDICDQKIGKKGPGVSVSFYAFFSNKNEDPQLLMEAAEWWISTHTLDHFEKAVRIKQLVQDDIDRSAMPSD
jgi:Family of unknown function (DUF6500)